MKQQYRYSLSILLLGCFVLACGFAGYRVGFNLGYVSGADKHESERPFVRVHSLDVILALADTNGVTTEDPGEWWNESLINMIFLTVAPDSWEIEGGPGYLAPGPDDRTLIVTQTASVHQEIENLLSDIEEIRRRAQRLPEYKTFASVEP